MKVQVERGAHGIISCWIDHPARRNALDDAMLETLADTLEGATGDPAIRAVFIRGRGAMFCAGRDLGELDPTAGEDDGALARRIAPALRLARAAHGCAVPTVAVVEGRAIGLGVALACWCDIAIATEDASFSIPEARVGIAPSFTAVSLMQTIGRRAALGLCVSGRVVSAAEALALGLVQQVCAAQALHAQVEALAVALRKAGPLALRQCKSLVEQAKGLGFEDAFGLAAQTAVHSMRGSEAAEGMRALREKRPPDWAMAAEGTP